MGLYLTSKSSPRPPSTRQVIAFVLVAALGVAGLAGLCALAWSVMQ